MQFLLFFFFSLSVHSSTRPFGCGVFDIYGRMEESKSPGIFQYVVHGKTVSEYKFNLTDTQEMKLAPYFGKVSKIRVSLLQEMTDFNGEFFEIESVVEVVPDPAFLSKNHGFSLIKKKSCK